MSLIFLVQAVFLTGSGMLGLYFVSRKRWKTLAAPHETAAGRTPAEVSASVIAERRIRWNNGFRDEGDRADYQAAVGFWPITLRCRLMSRNSSMPSAAIASPTM